MNTTKLKYKIFMKHITIILKISLYKKNNFNYSKLQSH